MWVGKIVSHVSLVLAVVAAAGCGGSLMNDGDTLRGPGLDGGVPGLEAEAKALATIEGCEVAAQCASAPVGVRACGGPRYYLPYCPLTTDTAALRKKIAEIDSADRDYNQRHNVVSTCEYRMPPDLAVKGGACVVEKPFSGPVL